MVYWITGRKGSGKTTLARKIARQTNGIILDGDEIRQIYPTGFSREAIIRHNRRITKLAQIFEGQGHVVIIACVSPFREWRKVLQANFKECIEIQLPFGTLWPGTVYEETQP